MAAWQFEIGLIPRVWAEAQCYRPDRLLVESSEATGDAWEEYPVNVDVASVIGAEFPVSQSWSEHLQCWGNEASTDVQVWSVERPVDEIWIRIDLCKSVELSIAKAVRIAKELDCVFFSAEKRLIVPARESVLKKMVSSSAAANYMKVTL